MAGTDNNRDHGPQNPAQSRIRERIGALATILAALIGTVSGVASLIDFAHSKSNILWQTSGIVLIAAGVSCGLYFAVKLQWKSLAFHVAGTALVVAGSLVILKIDLPPKARVSTSSTGGCTSGANIEATSDRWVLPLREDYTDTTLSFCRVGINGGRKVVSDYSLVGVVGGQIPAGMQLGILRYTDPTTCDAFGHPGSGGYWLKLRLTQKDMDRPWGINDAIQNEDSASIRRIFYFILSPPDGLDEIQRDNDDNRNNRDYPGFKKLPQNARRIASFAMNVTSIKECRTN